MLDTASYTYDANSNELTASLNGTVYKNSEYNFANLPTKIYYPNSGDDTNRIEYTYRVDGNMHSHRDYLDYTSARIYTYDGAGRLTMDFSALEDENYTDRYTYDARGNITQGDGSLVLTETSKSGTQGDRPLVLLIEVISYDKHIDLSFSTQHTWLFDYYATVVRNRRNSTNIFWYYRNNYCQYCLY